MKELFEQDAFVDHLLYQVGLGTGSVKGICESARSACYAARGDVSQTLIQVAKAGNWGTQSTNMERDLHSFAARYLPFNVEKYWLPIRVNFGQGEVCMQFPMLPVHEFLADLWERGESTFAASCFATDGAACVPQFWSHCSHMQWCKDHPCQQQPDRMGFTIPAAMFGDDARLYRNEKMIVWEFTMVLSPNKTISSAFLIGVLPYAWVVPGKTLQDIHRAVRWMWDNALSGKWATEDHLGRPLGREHGAIRYNRRGLPLTPGVQSICWLLLPLLLMLLLLLLPPLLLLRLLLLLLLLLLLRLLRLWLLVLLLLILLLLLLLLMLLLLMLLLLLHCCCCMEASRATDLHL